MPDLGLAGGAMPNGQVLDTTVAPTGTGPAASTSTAPAPYSGPIPGAAQYSQLIALAQKAYKQSVAELNQERGQLLQQYGYVGQIDPATGLVKNVHVDANNPYGAYQQTLRGYGQAADRLRESNSLRGIRGGLANQGMTAQKFAFGKDTSALAQALQQGLLKIQEGQTQDYFTEQGQIVNAQLAALNQAMSMLLSGQTIDPANLSGITIPGPNGTNISL